MSARAVVAMVLALAITPAAHAAGVRVAVDRTEVETTLGHKFEFRSTISNDGTAAAAGLIAHLNVLSLRGDVYVDPEDWSSHRTRYLAPIPAGGSTTLTWPMSAVNPGHLGVYVAVLPQRGPPVPPTTGPTVRVTVADRRTLNSGGIVPLALAVPAAIALLGLGVRLRRRQMR
jgi:hypothetical protein